MAINMADIFVHCPIPFKLYMYVQYYMNFKSYILGGRLRSRNRVMRASTFRLVGWRHASVDGLWLLALDRGIQSARIVLGTTPSSTAKGTRCAHRYSDALNIWPLAPTRQPVRRQSPTSDGENKAASVAVTLLTKYTRKTGVESTPSFSILQFGLQNYFIYV